MNLVIVLIPNTVTVLSNSITGAVYKFILSVCYNCLVASHRQKGQTALESLRRYSIKVSAQLNAIVLSLIMVLKYKRTPYAYSVL